VILQLLEHNLNDVGLVWHNTEQAIAQLQAIRDGCSVCAYHNGDEGSDK
jgi:hypothetical protein